ncbi:target of Sbf [Elasticomyces elasticus]|uniref:glucan endo-1,3-beta-D-glucosidase n=1 Tax=Exophiala sideris TaxID=1016849 RepID=A0ABR0IZ11_9EURO|nr:target of Sbf [Elasticomyces elasticus]KAK5022060.1 target of Sbf [Exophiala sideris]KAK5026271.1 target of Sbf [Exophiala sideris]KAK5051060.1 target of Sbf [Exophiala sideris]KAK5177295.1 target of Sbf [Eurotiomycetes sp. CCFEE 6388]
MKYAFIASALLAAAGTVAADCTEDAGNYYCSQVDAISYSNFGTAGQYQEVTYMGDSGRCDFSTKDYSGGMAPFDSEVSWHFRGPIRLKQFAFYSLDSTSSKSKRSYHPGPHMGRYAHQKIHQQQKEARNAQADSVADLEKRGVDWTDATIDGKAVSWTNQWSGHAETSAAAVDATMTETTTTVVWVTATIDGKVVSWTNNYNGATATSLQTVVSNSQAASAVAATVTSSSTETQPATSAVAATLASSSIETGTVAASSAVTTFVTQTVTSSSLIDSTTTETSSVATYQATSSSEVASTVAAPSSAASAVSASTGSSADSSSGDSSTEASSSAPSTEAATTATTASSSTSASSAATTSSAGSGSWTRQAYYNAEGGTATGLVFLNHDGGQGSGVFDYVWGNSLSYASSDNSEGVSSPTTLADTLVGDDSEFVIMTDTSCSDGTCGYYRNGTVAYHGFEGASKLFLLEFSMPLSGKTGFNADMPAVWMLNAQVPRTEQYGNCSCWESGCGEFDIFEVLDSGDEKAKSTWHGVNSLGDSDYFARPTSGTMKAAVWLDGSTGTAHIIVLDDSATFDSTITESTVAGYLSSVSSSESITTALPG